MNPSSEPQTCVKSEPDSDIPQDYVRHKKHYFEDGNIIFIVERTLFRLYRGFLARHSDVMNGMFGLASSDLATQETLDGVPAVALLDSSTDFAHMLDFLFAPHCPPYPPPSPDFEVLISVLKISKKYMFDSVREAAVWHLLETLPTSLENFVANPGLTMFTGVRAAQVIRAARDYNLPELLPLAMYAITTYPWGMNDPLAAEQVHTLLPPEDLARTIVGRTKIHSEALKMAFTMHEHGLMDNVDCRTAISVSRNCAKGVPRMLWLSPTEALEEFLRNPMRQLVIRNNCEFLTLCKPCVTAIREKMRDDLESFYSKLPEIFSLEEVVELDTASSDNTSPNDPLIAF